MIAAYQLAQNALDGVGKLSAMLCLVSSLLINSSLAEIVHFYISATHQH